MVSTEEKKARKFQKGLRHDIGGRLALDRFETMEAAVLAGNRAKEFNEIGVLKRRAQSVPTFNDRATKKPNYQPNRPPPPPRYQGGQPQQSQNQPTNNDSQRPQVRL